MFTVAQVSDLALGGLFASADEFDVVVRIFNQDLDKLVILSRRNKVTINHICLLQAREKSRVSTENRGKPRSEHVKPRHVKIFHCERQVGSFLVKKKRIVKRLVEIGQKYRRILNATISKL